MTVTTTESSNTWIADGSSNEFSFTFPILDKFNLLVKKQNPSELLTDMVLGIDYTVTGIGNIPERTNYKSGKIIFLQNIPAGSKIIIKRNIPKTQKIDYVENTGLPAQGHEEALDKITMVLQELNSESKQAVTLAHNVENIIPEISNIEPNDLLKIAPDGSGITGIKYESHTGIRSVYEDNSPTLSNTLNTNGHDIRFESDHGLVNSVDNPILTVKYDDQNTSHLEIDTTKEHQQPIIRATSDNENTNLMLEAKGNGSITTLNNLNALQGISVTGTIQAADNENDDADLVLNSKGSGNTIIDGVPVVNEINTTKNTITTLENKITNTEINITDAKESITTASTDVSNLENKVNSIESNIPDIENNITTALNNVNTMENNVTTALNEINYLENNITTLNNSEQTINEKINTTDATVNTLKNTATEASVKINGLETTVNNLENTVTTSSNKVNATEDKFITISNDIKIMKNNNCNELIRIMDDAIWGIGAHEHGFIYKFNENRNLVLDIILIEGFVYRKRSDELKTKDICLFKTSKLSQKLLKNKAIIFKPLYYFTDPSSNPVPPDTGYNGHIVLHSQDNDIADMLFNEDNEIHTNYTPQLRKNNNKVEFSPIEYQGKLYQSIRMPGEDYEWSAMIKIWLKNHIPGNNYGYTGWR